MNSNLNLAQPFIILIMRHWKGCDAVKCRNQSIVTRSWCKKWISAKPTLTPTVRGKHTVATILESTTQSQPSPTIHHTNNDR